MKKWYLPNIKPSEEKLALHKIKRMRFICPGADRENSPGCEESPRRGTIFEILVCKAR